VVRNVLRRVITYIIVAVYIPNTDGNAMLWIDLLIYCIVVLYACVAIPGACSLGKRVTN
jgi:hypothetical protein